MGLTAFPVPYSSYYGHVFVTGVELITSPPAVPLTRKVYVLPLTTLVLPIRFK